MRKLYHLFMIEISTELIKEAIYKLCFDANTCLDDKIYSKILKAYENTQSEELKSILQNAKIAYDTKKPLCQDTGQVLVFLEIGQEVHLTGDFIEDAINSAIEKCYIENYFRKSVVKNAICDRTNTNTNTPAIIYTKYTKGSEINIKVLIKGAGSENKSKLEMMLPTANEEEIIEFCSNTIIEASKNSCPPLFVGIGIGGSAEKAVLLSKEALLENEQNNIAKEIQNKSNDKDLCVLDVKVLSCATHIACMPVAITINCHSDRTSSCSIKNNKIIYNHKIPNFINFEENNSGKEIFINDITSIKNLKEGEEVLLTGEMFVARDMAHKRLKEMMDKGEKLPIDVKDKVIFYAGPCPNKQGEIIGSIGPTTSSRMDKYALVFYKKGILATVGKGNRSEEVKECIKKNNAKYFSITGGIAALLSNKVKKKEIIAFEDLGAEALYRIEVEKFPAKVEIG